MQRSEHFAKSHRCGRSAKRLPGLHKQWHVRHTQLDCFQIVRRFDFTVGSEVARTAGKIGKRTHLRLGDNFRLNVFAYRAGRDFVHIIQRLIRIRDGQKRRFGRPVLQALTGNRHINRAKLHPVDEVNLLAERVIRENLNLNATIGQPGNFLGKLERAFVPRVLLVGDMAELQGYFRFGPGNRRDASQQAGSQRSRKQAFFHLHHSPRVSTKTEPAQGGKLINQIHHVTVQ